MRECYIIHYFDNEVESLLTKVEDFSEQELKEYLDELRCRGCIEIRYAPYPQRQGAPVNLYTWPPLIQI